MHNLILRSTSRKSFSYSVHCTETGITYAIRIKRIKRIKNEVTRPCEECGHGFLVSLPDIPFK